VFNGTSVISFPSLSLNSSSVQSSTINRQTPMFSQPAAQQWYIQWRNATHMHSEVANGCVCIVTDAPCYGCMLSAEPLLRAHTLSL